MADVAGKPSEDEIAEERRRPGFSPLARRTAIAAALLASCAIAYGIVLAQFNLSKGFAEAEFGAQSRDAAVGLYLEPVQVDPINDSMQLRISVVPDASDAGAAPAIADRDRVLKIRRGHQIERVEVRTGQPLPEVTLGFDLDHGDVHDYPLDHYVADMTLAASDPTNTGPDKPLPIHVTIWQGVLGFSVQGRPAQAQSPGELELRFDIRRTTAVAFFGLAIYGAMAVMTLCAMLISGLVFIGVRRIEVTLIGALGAIIFALPALRNALPGTPPLGVRADTLIFFWAELGAILSLCLFIAAWARRGSRPQD